MFRIERTSDIESLLADTDTWNGLARGVPFRETSWLGPWWEHFGANVEAHVLIARDGDNMIRGILPLYRPAETPQMLAVIGDGLACSDYVSVLADAQEAEPIATAMGAYLAATASERLYGWTALEIDGIVQGDKPMEALARSIQEGGATVHGRSRMHTWYKPRAVSWDEHLKDFGKTQRRKMRRWSEKIDQTEGLEKIVANSAEQVQSLLDALIDLHQRRWNEVGEPGSYADSNFREFVCASAHDFFARGRLYLPTITQNEKVIGGELHFVGGNRRLYCYSSGYELNAADIEPGRILNVDTLMELYRSDFEGIDFLRGDEPYKMRMSAESRAVIQLRIAAPGLVSKVRDSAWRAGFEMKQWLRTHTGRAPINVVSMVDGTSFQNA